MGQVKLQGSVIIGPVVAGDDVFPGDILNVTLSTSVNPKPCQVWDGNTRSLNSPNAYAVLFGVGAIDTVTKGNFLVVRCVSPMMVRLTFSQLPVNIVSEFFVQGQMLIEIPDANPLIALEAKGSGFITYAVSGNQLH
jgi:hypothetical protein